MGLGEFRIVAFVMPMTAITNHIDEYVRIELLAITGGDIGAFHYGLGVIAVQARRLTDTMFMAAAKALAALSPARNDTGSNLLPPVTALREVSIAVARATAFQACKEGLTDLPEDEIDAAIHAKMWSPKYLPYRRTRARHDDRP